MKWLLSAFVALAFLPTAIAQRGEVRVDSAAVVDSTGWYFGQFTQSVSTTARPDYEYTGVFVLGPNTTPQVMFSCSGQSGLTVNVFLEPKTLEEIFGSKWRNWQTRRIDLSVEGLPDRDDVWMYIRTEKLLNSVKSPPAKRFYNAVVLEKPIAMKAQRIGKLDVSMPPVDDAFRQFIDNCPDLAS